MLRKSVIPVEGRRKGGRSRTAMVAVLVGAALLAAACGSSKTSTTPTTTAASTGGSATTTGGSGASPSSAIASAKAVIAKYEVQPTTLPITTPITKPIPKGKKVVFITCGVASCTEEGAIIKKATDYLGWTLQVINTDGSAQQVQNAWTQILREKPFGVLYTAFPVSEFQSSLAKASQEGIHVAACCVTDPIGKGLDWTINTAVGPGHAADGPLFANWSVANSPDGAPQVLYVNLPQFPILSSALTEFQASFSKLAPKGHLYTVDIPSNDIGASAGVDLVVSFLRAHPGVKFVISSTDSLTIGLPAAMKAAGLSGINVFGEGPTSTNAQYMKSGLQQGSVAFDYYEDMFGMVDALARLSVGQKVVLWSPPLWIVTGKNIPSVNNLFPVVVNSPAKFEALWK